MPCWSSRSQATARSCLSVCSRSSDPVSGVLRSVSGPAYEDKQVFWWEGPKKATQSQRLLKCDRSSGLRHRTDGLALQLSRQGTENLYPLWRKRRSLPVSYKESTVACRGTLKSHVKTSRVEKELLSLKKVQREISHDSVSSSSLLGTKGRSKADKVPTDSQSLSGTIGQEGRLNGNADRLPRGKDGPDKGRSFSAGSDADDKVVDASDRLSIAEVPSARASDGRVWGKGPLSTRVSDGAHAKQGVPGRTLLERGTRLIQTAPKESRWGDAHLEEVLAQGGESAGQTAPLSSSLDAIFGPIGRGRPKPRFTRNNSQLDPTPVSSQTLIRPKPRERSLEKDWRLHKDPSSGFLTGYDYDDDFAAPTVDAFTSLAPSSEWLVETCPACLGSTVVPCDVCRASCPAGACPKCKGKGYVACANCKGSGTVYGPVKRAQPVKAQPPKPSVQSSGGLDEDAPSLIEAYRIIKNERRSRSAVSSAHRESGEYGETAKPHWLRGRPMTEEHKRKISLALQGRPRSPLTQAHRKKLSDVRREFFEQPGAKERWSETAKRKRVMHCRHCGFPGHNSRFCPELGFVKHASKPCPICGQSGHTRHGCPKRPNVGIPYRCKNCGEYGHEVVNCPNEPAFEGRTLCEICGLPGHRNRECPKRPKGLILQRCSVCQQAGHNKRKCPERLRKGAVGEELFRNQQ